MIFEGDVLRQTVAVAHQHLIEPEALLAVVEVESAGKSLEIDGKTPCLLFERHIFYRELRKANKPAKLAQAETQGLAFPVWSPSTQYKDQRTSSMRLALYARAKAIDAECAARSCSWGVGQTCGFVAEETHFPDAVTMLAYMEQGGVPAQVDCMVREIENKKLVAKLNGHNWSGFARVYNGPGYAKNNYDGKMALAWSKWKRQLPQALGKDTMPAPAPVNVPPETKPKPAPAPHPPVKQAGILAAIVAAFAAVWRYISTVEFQIIAFAALVAVLVVITGIVLWRRRQAAQATQRGTLAEVGETA